MVGIDEKFKSMIGEQMDIREELKPIDRRLATLKKHIGRADLYMDCKGKKKLTESEQILFTAARNYLKGVMNGKTALPIKAWKAEYNKLLAERKTLNQRFAESTLQDKILQDVPLSGYYLTNQSSQSFL